MIATEIKNYNWGGYDFRMRNIEVLDTSLRDGAQDSQLRHPSIEEKITFVHKLCQSGIDAIDIAIPAARGPHLKNAVQLARSIPEHVRVVCLARTMEMDVNATLALAQGAGREIEGIIFVGSSPLRRFVEGWEIDEITRWMEKNVALAAREGIVPIVATEHTTETEPEVIKQIYRAGLDSGGKKVCIADTTGAADVKGVRRLMGFFQEEVISGFGNIPVEWHSHNDLEFAVANTMEALDAGAQRAHVSVLGIGERAGNTRLESLMINLKRAGDPRRQDLSTLPELAEYSSRIFDVAITPNYPGIGEKVGLTASGIHAAAMRKARMLGIEAGLPYSAVDQRWFGREGGVRIGPLSGEANVLEVAEKEGIIATPELVNTVLDFAIRANRVISTEDLWNIYRSLDGNGNGKRSDHNLKCA